MIALVTGASSGIGRAVAHELSKGNVADVVITGRSEARLRQTGQEIPGPWTSVLGDIRDPETIGKIKLHAPYDLVVHCAGELIHGPIASTTSASVRELMDVNFVASFDLLREITTSLSREADVVLINSTNGTVSPPGAAAYSATKHALRALADAYRAEVNHMGIRVMSVYVGKTATPMQQRVYAGRYQGNDYERLKDLMLQPEDVAKAVIALVSLPRTAEVTDLHIRPANRT